MDSVGISSNEDTFNALISHYDEKHRHYHNQNHIDAALQHLDDVSDLAKKPNEIELALWFHDAIYRPFSSRNELNSANWASEFLKKNDATVDVVARVHALIMATLHTGQAESDDLKLMIDIDLTILGAPENTYSLFEKSVRKEYRLVPYFIYRKKRKEILSSFLARERIFKNDYFYSSFEAQARTNLGSAIKLL